MNRTLLLLLTTILLAGNFVPRAGAATADSPEETIRGFYAWYVPATEAGGDIFKKNPPELRRYVSARFLKAIDRLRKSPDGLEADPFLNAQDSDPGWGKNVAVRNLKVEGETARADVTLTGKSISNHRLRVSLVREGGTWKLDRVAGQD